MKDATSVLISVGLLIVIIGWAYSVYVSIRKSKMELAERKNAAEAKGHAQMLIIEYRNSMYDHLAQPMFWINHISHDRKDITDASKVEFLKHFQDFYPQFECLVDWDGPNVVRVQRLQDWTLEVDRSKYEIFRADEDVMYVDDKTFQELKPQKLRRVK